MIQATQYTNSREDKKASENLKSPMIESSVVTCKRTFGLPNREVSSCVAEASIDRTG